jgi:ATP-dependent RNA helicase DDX31/DBP7
LKKFFSSGSGFSFEFNKDNKVQAKAIVRKRAKLKSDADPKPEIPQEPIKLLDSKPQEKKPKKKVESSFDLEEVLAKNTNLKVPEQLPTVDFPDEPEKHEKRSKKKNQDKKKSFAQEFMEKQETGDKGSPEKPVKRQKTKFSKISNPFPNQKPGKQSDLKPDKSDKSEVSENKKQVPNSENTNVFSVDAVDTLKIHPHAVKNLHEVLNITKLTHVQQRSIPSALEGKDLLIKSPTGSGKTLSYALPIVERLQNLQPKLNRSMGIHALVVVPTRELVLQTYEVFVNLLKPFQWIVPGYLSGGEKRKAEKSRLRKGITILVTTPGRICDHLQHTEAMKLDKVHILALDEADRLLELGYENDVKKIVETIDEHNKDLRKIQKILLSATLSAGVKRLAGLALNNPICVENESVVENSIDDMEKDDELVIPTGITQKYFLIPPKLRLNILIALMQQHWTRGARKILVFFPTQQVVDFHYDVMVDMLTQRFKKRPKTMESYLREDDEEEDDDIEESEIFFPGLHFFKLFGSMTQVERMGVFKKFRNSKAGILLCTDVAARGLDVPALDLVIQYTAPQELNMYIHRIGRTARAGNTGEAVIFLTQNEEEFIEVLKEKNIE